ncbi:unnamed protein product (mitochondrion) [Plasmodiophora brassicae]|uniref:RxLR effector candidate protein n=1 Tax=Plasmodiophora brassicae TaxID=37360 RepID=A0A3P3YKP1_PLABS|nr:unnamed protein product [Plasmodiophora brassicae]
MMARALFLALIVPLSSVLAAQVDDGERPATPGTDGGQKDGAPQGSQGTSFGDSITPMPGSFPKETANSNFGDKLSDVIETETVPEGDDEGVNGGLEDKPSGVIARLIAPAAGIVMEKADALGRSAIRSVRRKAVEKLGESLVENAEESVFNTVKNLRTYLQGSSDTPDDPANPDVTAVASEDDETQNGIGVHKDPSDSGSTEGHISAMTNQPMEKRNDEHEQNAQSTSDDVSNDLMHNDDQINRSLGDDPDGQDSGAAPPDQPSLPDKARRQVKSDVLGGAAAETSTSVPTLPGQTEINSEPPIPTTIPTKGTG